MKRQEGRAGLSESRRVKRFLNSFHSQNSELNMAELKEHKRGSNSTSKRKSRDVPHVGGSGASQSSYFERQPFRVGFSGLFVLQNSTTQSWRARISTEGAAGSTHTMGWKHPPCFFRPTLPCPAYSAYPACSPVPAENTRTVGGEHPWCFFPVPLLRPAT